MVTVFEPEGAESTFTAAIGWHVDDEGLLHVRESDGNAGVFNKNAWAHAFRHEGVSTTTIEQAGE